MPIEKPLPLMVGNKAYYSLTSYDPVSITVEVPYTSTEDVEMALQMTLQDLGATMADLSDPAWLSEHFEGLSSANQVRDAMRWQLETMNQQLAEQQKVGACVEALASRLGQSIPPQHLAEVRRAVEQSFTQSLQSDGLTPEQFMARTGTTSLQLEAMFDEQARNAAEGDAALMAYAREKRLHVDEDEFSALLGIEPDEMQKIVASARAVGGYDELQDAALRSKALIQVVSECRCTYQHETPQQARQRMAEYLRARQMLGADEPPADDAATGGKTGFKLV